jgi:putative glutamine amidotransferase
MQVLNVALGGTLAQHLPDTVGDTRHNHTPGQFADHEVRLEPGSLAARVAGGERVAVKSHHHQGVDLLGDGLRATGWSIGDDVLEAVELPDRRFALGLLWHPEEDPESSVVGSFVAEVGSVRA